MNAALDSPLEALAFNYLAYGFLTAVNNIWAWVAVITAAVSFWKMRAKPELMSSRSHDAASSPRVAGIATAEMVTVATTSQTAAPAPKASCRVLEREGSVKMKFSSYYEEREEVDDGVDSEESGGEAAVTSRALDDWETMMAMRMGDMGWYRWQERMVLDGSVVRLWEGRSPRHAAAQVVVGGVAW